MKSLKKILAMSQTFIMALTLLAGCGKGTSDSGSALTADEVALAQMEDCTLSDEEMLDVIKEYFDVFTALFEKTGENIVATVITKGDTVMVNTSRPELDDEGNPTGKTVTDEAVFEWDSARDAYAYLYQQGQVDLEGNLSFSKEDILAEQQPGDDAEVPDEEVDENISDTADEVDESDMSDSSVPSENTEPVEEE